jgi:glycosyltransferase involved in cell wall biosynthesis
MKSTFGTAFVSSYPPRACGIATFTRDLSDAVAQSGRNVVARVAAINDEGAIYSYPQQVRWSIDQDDLHSWDDVASRINKSRTALVSIQHEFGLYGRFERDGGFVDHLPGFLDRLEKPVISTLHSVLPHPRPDLRTAIRTLYDRSTVVVTMVNMARLILEEEYGLDPAKLVTIPHGVPEVRRIQPDRMKQAMQLEGRTVLSTFGLLSSGKGIQYVIRALPEVVRRHPDVLYLILGETHPEIRRREGEKYRNSLIDLIKKLRLEEHVRFVNHYLTQQQLIRYLQATDIYLTPYIDRYQITSGTLAYALGCGKAIISTPYLYAAEVLAEGRGVLAEFQDPRSFARCINMLLENEAMREQCASSAFAYGRAMSWSTIGAHYADLFHTILGASVPAQSVNGIEIVRSGTEGISSPRPPVAVGGSVGRRVRLLGVSERACAANQALHDGVLEP